MGSVQGQRFWATILPNETSQQMERELDLDEDEEDDGGAPLRVTCGTWTPDDQQIYLGTDRGSLLGD